VNKAHAAEVAAAIAEKVDASIIFLTKRKSDFRLLNHNIHYHKMTTAQRFALPALGWGRRSRPTRKMLRRRKLLEICAESPASGARFVGQLFDSIF